jgi:hypothetical protein
MFASADDLGLVLQTSFDPSEYATAELLLELAAGRIRGWTGQSIAPAVEETYDVWDAGGHTIHLPHPPTIPVSGVTATADGQPVDVTVDRLHRVRRADRGRFVGNVQVVYTVGFAEAPADVKDVCLKLAVRQLTNPTYSQSVKLEGFSETFQTASATSEEALLEGLSRFRLQAVA